MNRSTLLARELAGVSPVMVRLRRRIERIAGTSVSVLITGETGTGKTTAARVLHAMSQRARRPLVKVNCSGIPDTLFESEFFGHEKGAFTGAVSRRRGLMPGAHGGSLFLDEIGDLSLAGQAKLLTALDEGEVRPVGSETTERVDARVLSATSRDLEEAIRSGAFRADLFHRIAVVRTHLPPLRERREDLPLLVRTYLRRMAARHGLPVPGLSREAWDFLEARPWPGNVRELAHLLEAALVLAGSTEELRRGDLEDVIPERSAGAEPGTGTQQDGGNGAGTPGGAEGAGIEEDPEGERAPALRVPSPPGPPSPPRPPGAPGAPASPAVGRYSAFGSEAEERARILRALETCHGNRTRAARLLGMSRNTLRDRLRRYFPDGGA
jgi:DNA-binding NtrC family response regulator